VCFLVLKVLNEYRNRTYHLSVTTVVLIFAFAHLLPLAAGSEGWLADMFEEHSIR
jgi:hypothetical protein